MLSNAGDEGEKTSFILFPRPLFFLLVAKSASNGKKKLKSIVNFLPDLECEPIDFD